jgi:RNA polymerase sigma-70 factor (ECF subfamily)
MNATTVQSEAARQQFIALMEQHRRMVFKVASTYARPADREDLAQEIATQVWRAFAKYDASRPFPRGCIASH